MDALQFELRYAVRSLLKSPTFTLVAILTLALGIAANTAVYSLVDAILLRSLPYPDAGRIVMLVNAWAHKSSPLESSTRYEALRQRPSFDLAAAYRVVGVNLEVRGQAAQLLSLQVTEDFFRLFGASIGPGRAFHPDDFQENSADVVVLTRGLWQQRFGGDPGIIGTTVDIDHRPVTVVGVVGGDFDADTLPYAVRPEVFVPLRYDVTGQALTHYLVAAARLKVGTSVEAARADVQLAAEEFRRRFPNQIDVNDSFGVERLQTAVIGDIVRPLGVLAGAVACVLLIACANVANLLFARGAVREREMAIRAAIGASGARIVRQLLTECVVFAVPGGILGLVAGTVSIREVLRILPGTLPRLGEHGSRLPLHWPVFVFTAVLSTVTVVVFGLVPAVHASDSHFYGARTRSNLRAGRARSLLIMTETALAVVLLVGATLFVRTFIALQRVSPGFDGQHVLTVPMSLGGLRFARTDALTLVIRNGIGRLKGIGDVEAAAAGCCPPMLGRYGLPFSIVGRPPAQAIAGEAYISAGYLELFKIPLMRGRTFTDQDDRRALPVVVINDIMARQFWPDRDPLSDEVHIGAGLGPEWADPPRQIVGIVGDVRGGGLDRPPVPMMYVPIAQSSDQLTVMHARVPMLWFVRTRSNPFTVSALVQRELTAVTGVPVAKDFVRSMDQMVAESTSRQRFNMVLMTLFGCAALLLAGVGIYGVTTFLVQQRTGEIGIRLALGATPTGVWRMVVVQSARMAAAGVAIGMMVALAVVRLVATMLFGVTTHDVVTFVAVPCVLLTIACVAAWVPGRQAAAVDPMIALRAE